MPVAVKVRRILARHPWIHWASCAALAAGAGVATERSLGRVDAERRSWGATQHVWVAAAEVGVGDVVVARATAVPVAVIPPDALTSPPDGAIARQRITTGEIVVGADVAAPVGPGALAQPGTVVVGVVDPLARGVRIGATVQVTAGGTVVSDAATVVAVSDDVLQLAVTERDAPVVAAAAHDGLASVLLVP